MLICQPVDHIVCLLIRFGNVRLCFQQACKQCEQGVDLNAERGCRPFDPTKTGWKGGCDTRDCQVGPARCSASPALKQSADETRTTGLS